MSIARRPCLRYCSNSRVFAHPARNQLQPTNDVFLSLYAGAPADSSADQPESTKSSLSMLR